MARFSKNVLCHDAPQCRGLLFFKINILIFYEEHCGFAQMWYSALGSLESVRREVVYAHYSCRRYTFWR